MRLRKPAFLPDKIAEPKNGLCKKFNVELITPLYGGGVEAGKPDQAMPIRASAIRGQLRFWWRVLNPLAKFEDEKAIWGGMGEKEAVASRVQVRVTELVPEKPRIEPCAKYEHRDGRLKGPYWQHNIPGYALFPGQGKTERGEISEEPKKVILPDLKFTLEVRVDDKSLWDDVLRVLRWWASFGGLGARTRRGLGSIKVEGIDPITDISAVPGCRLEILTKKHLKATDAWTAAVSSLQKFRQGANIGRNSGNGRSFWPEPDSIRKITGCALPKHSKPDTVPIKAIPYFPRAVFGLPIITHFKDGSKHDMIPDREPADTTLKPVNSERLASPLILKAMWTKDGYQAIALLLPYQHALDMELELTGPGKNLPKRMKPKEWWPQSAKSAMTNPQEPQNNSPLKDRSGDVLQAFMQFFTEGN